MEILKNGKKAEINDAFAYAIVKTRPEVFKFVSKEDEAKAQKAASLESLAVLNGKIPAQVKELNDGAEERKKIENLLKTVKPADVEKLSDEDTFELADEIGIQYPKNIKAGTLKTKIIESLHE